MANVNRYNNKGGSKHSPFQEWEGNGQQSRNSNYEGYDNHRSNYGNRFERGDRYDYDRDYSLENYRGRPYEQGYGPDFRGYDPDHVDSYYRSRGRHYNYGRRFDTYGAPDYGSSYENNHYNPIYNDGEPIDYRYGGDGRYANSDMRGRPYYPDPEHRNIRHPEYESSWNRGNSNRNSFRGKGPKGYERSDERIREDLHEKLSDDPFLDPSEIEVSVTKGEVVLTGMVDSRMDKRRAEDIAERILGVRNVENRIRINPDPDSQGSQASKTFTGNKSKQNNI